MNDLWIVLILAGGAVAVYCYLRRISVARTQEVSDASSLPVRQSEAIERMADEQSRQRLIIESQTNTVQQLSATHADLVTAVQSQIEPPRRAESSIRSLSFEESLNPDLFASAARKSALGRLTEVAQAHAADGSTIAVNSARLIGSKVEMLVTASQRGGAMVLGGRITGGAILLLVWRSH